MDVVAFLRGMTAFQAFGIIAAVQIVIGLALWKTAYRAYLGQILVTTSILTMTALFYALTYGFHQPRGMTSGGTTAATVPRLWGILMIPVGVTALASIFMGKERKDTPFGRVDVAGMTVLLVVVSILLFNTIGYYISSALFLFALMWLFKYRNKVALIVIPLCWVVFTNVLFARLLYIPLPVGRLFERFLY